jgi:hypothetical protein
LRDFLCLREARRDLRLDARLFFDPNLKPLIYDIREKNL